MSTLLRLNAGLLLWAVGFCAIYALHGLGCEAGWAARPFAGTSLHRAVLLATWLAFAALGALLWAWLRRRPPAGDLADRIAAPVALVGLAATIVGGLPIVTIPDCL